MRKRKTADEYQIHQLTSEGWEEVTCYETWGQCREGLKEYRENQPGYAFKMKKTRVKL